MIMVKVTKGAPEVPNPPTVPRHDCGEEIRTSESAGLSTPGAIRSYRRFGMVVECSCGKSYELRRINFARFLVGELTGNAESIYSATQYWARIRRAA
jgi:hypothetical protein